MCYLDRIIGSSERPSHIVQEKQAVGSQLMINESATLASKFRRHGSVRTNLLEFIYPNFIGKLAAFLVVAYQC
jgi:hypothetical protein